MEGRLSLDLSDMATVIIFSVIITLIQYHYKNSLYQNNNNDNKQ